MKHLISAFAALLLCGCAIHSGAQQTLIAYDHAENYLSGGAVLGGPVRVVEVEWLSGQVEVESHPGSSVQFSERSARPLTRETALHYWLEGDVLHIQPCAAGQQNTQELEKDLLLQLPEALMPERVTLHSTSADLTAKEISCAELCQKSVSGALCVNACAAEKTLTLETTSGTIQAAWKGTAGTVEAKTISGAVTLNAASAGNVAVSTTSGAVQASLQQVTGKLAADTISGTVTLDAAAREIAAETTSGTLCLTARVAPEALTARTISGAVTLALPRDANCSLHFQTVSGSCSCTLPCRTENGRYLFGAAGGPEYTVTTTSGSLLVQPAG